MTFIRHTRFAIEEAAVSPRTPAKAFAVVKVSHCVEVVADAWAMLETSAPCSIYQTRAWLVPWLQTLAERAGLKPLFILAKAADARPVALLCLGLKSAGPLRIATWLGGKDANFNLALFRNGDDWTANELERLFKQAARACGRDAPHLFVLPNQPTAWVGKANPLARLRHQASPSAAYGTTLSSDADGLLAIRLSKESRKKLRKKEAKLVAGFGAVTYRVADDPAKRAAVIDAFLAQKTARFRTQKIRSDFEAPEMRAFIEAASGSRGGIVLHALLAGDRIVAVYGGAAHDGRWSGMFNSFDADDEIAPSSPGDLLLTRIIAKLCADGLTHFDLGIGEARYKNAFCDEAIPLFDLLLPITPLGRLYALALAARLKAKRGIKENPRLLRFATKIRALRR